MNEEWKMIKINKTINSNLNAYRFNNIGIPLFNPFTLETVTEIVFFLKHKTIKFHLAFVLYFAPWNLEEILTYAVKRGNVMKGITKV